MQMRSQVFFLYYKSLPTNLITSSEEFGITFSMVSVSQGMIKAEVYKTFLTKTLFQNRYSQNFSDDIYEKLFNACTDTFVEVSP